MLCKIILKDLVNLTIQYFYNKYGRKKKRIFENIPANVSRNENKLTP